MNILTTAKIGAYLIAGIAGVMSYGHQKTLLLNWDCGPYSYAVPITVDVLAFLAALVRGSENADAAAKRAATWTLVLAGSASIAANVAVGENLVQRIVGVWTVAAYLLAEYFVSKLRTKQVEQLVDEHAAPAPAAAVEPANVLAFRAAQQELRRTSRLAGLAAA